MAEIRVRESCVALFPTRAQVHNPFAAAATCTSFSKKLTTFSMRNTVTAQIANCAFGAILLDTYLVGRQFAAQHCSSPPGEIRHR
jgi:hypothetical protein